MKTDLTIRHAQKTQPWTVPYAWDKTPLVGFEGRELSGRHALFHAQKSLGKIAAVYEAVDHRSLGNCPKDAEIEVIQNMSADLLTVALRYANLYGFDLQSVLVRRVAEKNGETYQDEQ